MKISIEQFCNLHIVFPLLVCLGSERALQILQSSFVWSSAPYDSEAIDTLHLLARMAPVRKLKNFVQSVAWPEDIYTHAAQDTFLIVAQKLVTDSKRLEGLHLTEAQRAEKEKKDAEDEQKKKKRNENEEQVDKLKETKRDYFRCLQNYPNLRISESFLTHEPMFAKHYEHNDDSVCFDLVRQISVLYHEVDFRAPLNLELKYFLFKEEAENEERLGGIVGDDDEEEPIIKKFNTNSYTDSWISLYEKARRQSYSREKFILILTLLAKKGFRRDEILALQTVMANPAPFQGIAAPQVASYNLKEGHFKSGHIKRIVINNYVEPENYNRWGIERQHAHDQKFNKFVDQFIEAVTEYRQEMEDDEDPAFECSLRFDDFNIDMDVVIVLVNAMLKACHDMKQLKQFINRLQHQFDRLITNKPPMEVNDIVANTNVDDLYMMKFNIDYDRQICDNLDLYKDEIVLAEQIYRRNESEPMPPLGRSAEEWWTLFKEIATSSQALHLVDAGMYPRFVPSFVLPKILPNNQRTADVDDQTSQKMEQLCSIIGAMAVTMSCEQRQKRIKTYEKQSKLKAALNRELENQPFSNWLPCEYPQWLLFEIEQNLTIRRIQIEIAKRMIDPPEIGTKHSVMQLNMGEGKTAVIVPILATYLANDEHACQVTVLRSLFATNLKLLRQCLGGMLNQKVYTFPCRRDLPVNEHIDKMLDMYKECKEQKGKKLTTSSSDFM